MTHQSPLYDVYVQIFTALEPYVTSLIMGLAYMMYCLYYLSGCLQDLSMLSLLPSIQVHLTHFTSIQPFLELTPSYHKYEAPKVFLWITFPSSRNRRSSYRNRNIHIPSPSKSLKNIFMCSHSQIQHEFFFGFVVDLLGIRFLPEPSKGRNLADPVASSLTSKF